MSQTTEMNGPHVVVFISSNDFVNFEEFHSFMLNVSFSLAF
jgi:hypothetical protein